MSVDECRSETFAEERGGKGQNLTDVLHAYRAEPQWSMAALKAETPREI